MTVLDVWKQASYCSSVNAENFKFAFSMPTTTNLVAKVVYLPIIESGALMPIARYTWPPSAAGNAELVPNMYGICASLKNCESAIV